MCPYYYKAYTGKPHEIPLHLCRANDMDVITDDGLEKICRNNCMSCYIYRRASGGKPPERIQQYNNNNNSKSSGGFGGFIIFIIVGAIATKYFGLW